MLQKISQIHLKQFVLIRLFLSTFIFLLSFSVQSAPKKELLPEWQQSQESSTQQVDHSDWDSLLARYVTTKNRQTYFNYKGVSADSLNMLDRYLQSLVSLDPLLLNRAEQKAYWINLYNAATVRLVLKHYPVRSITKLGKGLFSFGPWDDNLLTINDRALSLNDIEHGILRPVYNDERIHYAVNCASLSCPNLLPVAFTAQNMEVLLEQAAADYINHPRGAMVVDGELVLSTIYRWYQVDFGQSEADVLHHLQQYAEPALQSQLSNINTDDIQYEYNWSLNE